MSKKVNGAVGWVILFGLVAAWDLAPQTETLSRAFDRNKRRPLVSAGVVFLVLHLYRRIPARYDPLRRFTHEH